MKTKIFVVALLLVMSTLYAVGASSTTDNMIWKPDTIIIIDPGNNAAVVSDRLNAGDLLKLGESIKSKNGKNILRLQNDGNLVLYNSDNKILWSSNTKDKNVGTANMQKDGNFVIKDVYGTVVWATNTNGNPGAYLVVQDDGNVVIYIKTSQIWSTNTGGTTIQTPVTPIPVPQKPVSVSAYRTIEDMSLIAGGNTKVTVSVKNDGVVRSLSLKESIPSGWKLAVISDDANSFKTSTNEWAWYSAESNSVKTVNYRLYVPYNTAQGTYNINGNIATSDTTIGVKGDNTITIGKEDILQYYRGMNFCYNIVETNDLLKAADDWTHNIIPSGFSASITTTQLLTLADEWIASGTSCGGYT